ncbi:class I SAM-dependent methyltransferase [Pseudonocardia xishanensis]|uniref:Class I SAM-dependent methyltransferase n=1 Tax=Pseudonocardia xishanensis TaxID=630995 RepID=A0ABP8RZS5_9PSEU
MTTTTAIDAVRTKHRALWASGSYATVAADLIPTLGAALVEASGIGSGDRVLDIGAGTGNASVPAARTGASVVASDLTPELLDVGRAAHPEIEWVEADAHALPFETAEFDAALSCVGIMFAPFHARAAGELLRVVRPGGRIALLNWTPEGFVGQLFATMKPFAPPPPPGASPAPLWGREDHVRELLGDGVRGLTAVRATATFDLGLDPEGFREWWKANYGPTIATYKAQEDPTALDTAFLGFLERTRQPDGTWESEYLVVTADRT